VPIGDVFFNLKDLTEKMQTTKAEQDKRTKQIDVVRELGKKLVSGYYVPEDLLPSINELKEEFGVSLSVVREAFKVLYSKGLIESRQKRGTIVCRQTDWNLLDEDVLQWYAETERVPNYIIEDLFELRMILEPDVAKLASLNATPPQIRKIRKGFERMTQSVQDQNLEAYLESDVSFHVDLFHASNNIFLKQLSGTVKLILIIISLAQRSPLNPLQESLPLHKHVMDAVVDGNPEKAHARMLLLLQSSKVLYKKIQK